MSTDTIHPAQDLINRIIELQYKLEDFKPMLGKHAELKVEYDSAYRKVSDARVAINALVGEFNRVPRDDSIKFA